MKDKDKDKNDGRVEEFAKKSMFKHCTAGFAEAVLTQMTTQMFYPGQAIMDIHFITEGGGAVSGWLVAQILDGLFSVVCIEADVCK